jgi:hypothetical protein
MLGKAGCTGALCWLEIVGTVDWLLLEQHLTLLRECFSGKKNPRSRPLRGFFSAF